MWQNINQTYSTPHSMNAWAALPAGWRKVKPLAADGVTNTFLLLALARATNKQAHVTTDGVNEITAVYL
ncbi:MAG TPA: hypothetical protein VEQ60_19735 [Longimicrobium sp.]|nr:hypothetical protein [Longimicrobium sp.]